MKDIMVDLETMGNSPRAAIVAIGAVAFDLDGPYAVAEKGVTFYRTVSLQSCIDAGLRVDGGTVDWWMGQSEEARAALREPKPIGLPGALADFASFVRREGNPRVWAHATFDLPILTSAFIATRLSSPWKYALSRDVRTIYDLAYPGARVPGVPDDGKHHALRDAYRQAIGVQVCYRRLQGSL